MVEGKGNTTNVSTYTFMDAAPLHGSNYYLLKQVDSDETIAYSSVTIVHISATKACRLYPKPAQDMVNEVFGDGIKKFIIAFLASTEYK